MKIIWEILVLLLVIYFLDEITRTYETLSEDGRIPIMEIYERDCKTHLENLQPLQEKYRENHAGQLPSHVMALTTDKSLVTCPVWRQSYKVVTFDNGNQAILCDAHKKITRTRHPIFLLRITNVTTTSYMLDAQGIVLKEETRQRPDYSFIWTKVNREFWEPESL